MANNIDCDSVVIFSQGLSVDEYNVYDKSIFRYLLFSSLCMSFFS